MLYLDHAATTLTRPEAREAMGPYLKEVFGNASGVHEVSRRAKNGLEEARERAAALLGASHPLDIVFTGGGTEADNLAVVGSTLAGETRGGVVTTAVEHDAVLQSVGFLQSLGCRADIVGVGPNGRIDPEEVTAAISSNTAVVSVMTANNETGTVFPVHQIAEMVHAAAPQTLVHTDAVQAFVTEDVTVETSGADMISLAGHKFGGPKGVGLLYVPREISLEALIHGGGQELGRRSGTYNVAGIVGMVAAMEVAVTTRHETRARVLAERDSFEAALLAAMPDLEVNGDIAHRLVQHSHLRIPGVAAETLLIRLDQEGVAASAGSACHSGAIEVSHVLAAMGRTDDEAGECVRFSFGWSTERGDGVTAAHLVAAVAGDLR